MDTQNQETQENREVQEKLNFGNEDFEIFEIQTNQMPVLLQHDQ